MAEVQVISAPSIVIKYRQEQGTKIIFKLSGLSGYFRFLTYSTLSRTQPKHFNFCAYIFRFGMSLKTYIYIIYIAQPKLHSSRAWVQV